MKFFMYISTYMHEIVRSTPRYSGTQPIRGNELEAGEVTGFHSKALHPIIDIIGLSTCLFADVLFV